MNGPARHRVWVNRRPLCFAAVACLIGIFAARLLFQYAVAVVAGLLVLAVLTASFRLSRSLVACSLVCAAAFLMAGVRLHPVYATLPEGECVLYGRVCEWPEREAQHTPFEKTRVFLEDVRLQDGEALSLGVLLEIGGAASLEYGDEVEVRGQIALPAPPMNPGQMDTRLRLLIRGVGYVAQSDAASWKVVGHSRDLYGALLETRQGISDKIDGLFDSAPVIRGVLLGDTDALEWDQAQAYLDLGLYHLFSVSGFHAAIFAGAVIWILDKLHKKRWALWIAGPMLLAYTALVGFAPPMVRALVMCVVMMGALAVGRRNDMLTSLAAALLVLLAINPLYAFDIGFQLSFASVFGMAALLPLFSGLMKRSGVLLQGLAVSFCAQCGTFGLSAYYFNRQSILGFAANVVILPLFSLIVLVSMAAVAVGFAFPGAGLFLAQAVDAFLVGIDFMARQMGSVPWAAVSLASPQPWLAALLLVVVFAASPYLMVKARPKAMVVVLLLGAMAAAYVLPIAASHRAEAVFFQGTGRTAFLRTLDGENYVVDDGVEIDGIGAAVRYMRKRGYTDAVTLILSADTGRAYRNRATEYLGAEKVFYVGEKDEAAVGAERPVAAGQEIFLGEALAFCYGQSGFYCYLSYEEGAVLLLEGDGAAWQDRKIEAPKTLLRPGDDVRQPQREWAMVVLQGGESPWPYSGPFCDTDSAGAVTALWADGEIDVQTMHGQVGQEYGL
ncbi:MAG: ComEC/Rec2 family competence protein [Christensenellales bacterium]|jgi:ComEC/Rec2-related protein